MFQVVIGIGILLIVLILFMLFRIGTLLDVVKGSGGKTVTKSNKINASLCLVLLIVGFGSIFAYSYIYFDDYNLPLASEHGVDTDFLFWVTMAITGVVFFITHILLFIFPIQYSYSEKRRALFFPENHKLELIWTILPAIVLSVLIFSGLKVWGEITSKAPDNAEVVEIMGQQFAWTIRYPGSDNRLGGYDFRLISADNKMGVDFTDDGSFDDFSPREIHLPKGTPILFKIRARDVLHSVFAPHFRVKMDAVPGMPTSFHFVPTKTTAEMRVETNNPDFNYELACAEICGRGHFAMRMIIVVDTPEDYEKWKSEQTSLVAQNEALFALVPDGEKELAKVKGKVVLEEVTEEEVSEEIIETEENVEEAQASL